jgi:acyl carrier protein
MTIKYIKRVFFMKVDEKYLESVVHEVILECLDLDVKNSVDGFTEDTKLFQDGLGWDSLELLEALSILEEKLDIVIEPSTLKELKTVKGIVNALKKIIENK